MKLNWNFQRGGGGAKKKNIHGEGMDIFWNHTICQANWELVICKFVMTPWMVKQMAVTRCNN